MANGPQDTNTFIKKLLYGLLRRQRSHQVSDGQGVGRPLTREESIMGVDPAGITTDVQSNLIFPLDCGHSGGSTVAGRCFCGA